MKAWTRKLVTGALLAGIASGCGLTVLRAVTAGTEPAVVDFLRRHAATIDLREADGGLGPDAIGVGGRRVFLLGEVHGVATNYAVDLALLHHLHRVAGVRVYLMEFSHAHAEFVNLYLETGDTTVLDSLFGPMAGFVDCSEERRRFFVGLRAWNVELPAAERVRVVGFDLERMAGISLAFLREEFAGLGKTPPLRPAVGSLLALPAAPAPVPAVVRQIVTDLVTDVAAHRADYASRLGRRWFDVELALDNLRDQIRAQADRSRYDAVRDAVQYHNFARLAEHAPFTTAYGRAGSAHVLQRATEGIEHFSARLESAGSPWAGRVVGIWPLYANSQRLAFGDGRYGVLPCADDLAVTKPFLAAAASDLVLFDLTGPESPFARARLLPGEATTGVTTDYFQYVVLMKSAPAATPIPAVALTTDSRAAFVEKQLTHTPQGHVLTNINVWSPDGNWVVYDVRTGDDFNGTRIEEVNVATGEVRRLYESRNGSKCGVATFSPAEPRVIFIQGPENPTAEWSYGFTRRHGVWVDALHPGAGRPLDAMNYAPPFAPGALRGGSHVHVFSPDGSWVSFTYEDEVLARLDPMVDAPPHEPNQRNVGVAVPRGPVRVSRNHPRNHDGDCFSVVVTRTLARPRAGSDEISRAFEEGWVGRNGYVRADGSRQQRALAFQGLVTATNGSQHAEVFIVDLPDDLTRAADTPLEGTATTRPAPPLEVKQRRLTFTSDRKFPGVVQIPRHWLRVSPDGGRIAFLMKDDGGVVQLWTVSPLGGEPRQLTRNSTDIASAFSWSPDGTEIAHLMDGSVCVTNAVTGQTGRLTPKGDATEAPLPLACVFSPDGHKIAYMREVGSGPARFTQIFSVTLK